MTSVDVSAAAHATAQASFRASGLDPRKHAFVTADAYAFLEKAGKQRQTWDLVISDPPSFAPSEKAVPRALAAYRSLHQACAAVLAPGGRFCAASCSSHVPVEPFSRRSTTRPSAGTTSGCSPSAGRGRITRRLAAFPEGRYLKFVVMG